MKLILAATAILAGLAACSPETAAEPDPASNIANQTAPSAAEAPPAAPPPPPAEARPADKVLSLEGLGALRIGEKVPAASGWAERGAQISDSCRIIGSPDFPGVYAIVEEGKVRRITIGSGSAVRLVEGIFVGSSEAEVRSAFAGFREQPHEYSEAPTKYLTAPNAESGDPALRFEIDADRKVSLIHVGTKPMLFYVEGCA